jgi:hypothetical protein
MNCRSLAAGALGAVLAACGQSQPANTAASAAPPPAPAKGSREWLIQTAMSAAPASISGSATLLDMNAKVDSLKVLRAGTNGWTCVADDTTAHHMGPVCVDQQWMKWLEALMTKKTPTVTMVGTAYMLAGANDASNTDPFATAPPAGKDWVVSGPHIMTLSPGAHAYDAMPKEVNANAPYVMFAGTPYAHVMVPVGPVGK